MQDSCSKEKCSLSLCRNEGTCAQNDPQCQHNSQLCTTKDCLQHSVDIWDFWNNSYIELPTLQGVSQAFRIEGIYMIKLFNFCNKWNFAVWIMARSPNGVIFYNGQSKGDFVELSLVEGFLHYSFNLGGQSNKR